MNYLIGYYSDKGIRKEVNQDALLIKTCKSPYGRIGLFIVCDGMGGLQQGELASSTVINMFSNWFDNDIKNINFENFTQEEIFNIINELINDVNRKMIEYGQENNCKLGTTITLMLTVDVYFADPYSSWQRGSNENTNGLIREFFPKKFDFSTITQKEVDIVEGYLNNRPRKCLGYKTPLEAFNEEQAKCCT